MATRIMLVCAAGMSTSLLVTKMESYYLSNVFDYCFFSSKAVYPFEQ